MPRAPISKINEFTLEKAKHACISENHFSKLENTSILTCLLGSYDKILFEYENFILTAQEKNNKTILQIACSKWYEQTKIKTPSLFPMEKESDLQLKPILSVECNDKQLENTAVNLAEFIVLLNELIETGVHAKTYDLFGMNAKGFQLHISKNPIDLLTANKSEIIIQNNTSYDVFDTLNPKIFSSNSFKKDSSFQKIMSKMKTIKTEHDKNKNINSSALTKQEKYVELQKQLQHKKQTVIEEKQINDLLLTTATEDLEKAIEKILAKH